MWPPCPRQGHAVGPGSDVQEGEKRCHIVFMEKSYPMNVLLAFPVIGIFSIIAALLCFKYKLFYHKAHVLVLSIIIGISLFKPTALIPLCFASINYLAYSLF